MPVLRTAGEADVVGCGDRDVAARENQDARTRGANRLAASIKKKEQSSVSWREVTAPGLHLGNGAEALKRCSKCCRKFL